MGIVRFALKFPHTFYVVAALVVFLGSVAIGTPIFFRRLQVGQVTSYELLNQPPINPAWPMFRDNLSHTGS